MDKHFRGLLLLDFILITPLCLATQQFPGTSLDSPHYSAQKCGPTETVSFVRTSRSYLAGSQPITSLTNIDASACALHCRNDKDPSTGNFVNCHAFNVDIKEKTCQFFDNPATPVGTGDLLQGQGHSYYEKVCFRGISPNLACTERGHSFERVSGHKLEGLAKAALKTGDRAACLLACLIETKFICKSVNYNYDSYICELSDEDRRSRPHYLVSSSGAPIDYFDNNCLNRQTRCGAPDQSGNLIFVKTQYFEIHYHDKAVSQESSESYCLQSCLDSLSVFCRSVEFDTESGKCVLSDEDTLTAADAQGTPHHDEHKSYYEPICVKSDLSSSTCRQQAAFIRHMGKTLQHTPIAKASKVTVSDCISLCFQNLDCKSIDYDRSDLTCYIHGSNGASYGNEESQLVDDPSRDHYDFRCESEFGGMAQCTDQGIKFTVNTKVPYSGAIYAAEKYSTCHQEAQNSRQITLLLPPPSVSGNCGTKIKDGRLEVDVVVSLDGVMPHQVTTEWDRFYKVSCDTTLQGAGEGSVIVTTIFDAGDSIQLEHLPAATPGPASASLSFVDYNNAPVNTVLIGQQIHMIVQSPDSGPDHMMLMDCTANRAGGAGQDSSFKVIENGCPTYPALVGPVQKDYNGNRLSAIFKAFRLDGSFDVRMTCNVVFCAGPTGCPPSNCLDSGSYKVFQSVGRKKRSIITNNTLEGPKEYGVEDEKELKALLRVLASGEDSEIDDSVLYIDYDEDYNNGLGHSPEKSQNLVDPDIPGLSDDMMCINESAFIAIIVTVSLLCVVFSMVIVAWGCSKLKGSSSSDLSSGIGRNPFSEPTFSAEVGSLASADNGAASAIPTTESAN